ncbi:MAG: hypothetical protein Q4P34_08945, partial [Tissierellia bacterium]|nr:hypothetical protein [Tissierellia bacterium]
CDLSVSDIKLILKNDSREISNIIRGKKIRSKIEKEKIKLLEEYNEKGYNEEIRKKLSQINKKEKLVDRFQKIMPGYLGQMLIINFMPYLNCYLDDEEQEKAFKNIISILDEMPEFKITDRLKNYLDEVTKEISIENMQDVNREKMSLIMDIENIDSWIETNKEELRKYIDYKNSEEYLNSDFHKIQKEMKTYLSEFGFYDRIIPEMRNLSSDYDDYYKNLLSADKKLQDKIDL